MFGAKLRQIRFGLRNPRATVAYPLGPKEPEKGYRGRVAVTTEHCVGCGGCADVCPSRCILITDLDTTTRVMRRFLDRCVQCGRCEEACSYDAVRMVADWETGTPDRHDLFIEQTLFMGVCDRCGRCYIPAHPLDRLNRVGTRMDEPGLLEAFRARRARGDDGGGATATAAAAAPGGVEPPGAAGPGAKG